MDEYQQLLLNEKANVLAASASGRLPLPVKDGWATKIKPRSLTTSSCHSG